MSVWVVYRISDMTEGRGLMEFVPSLGWFPTEQAAWDRVNDLGGVMGRHPSHFDFGMWVGVDNWQQYAAKYGRGDYDVRFVAAADLPVQGEQQP